jgi:MEMO1 family protein
MRMTLLITSCILLGSCQPDKHQDRRIPVDTIGFAQYGWQMDSLISRIERNRKTVSDSGKLPFDSSYFSASRLNPNTEILAAISPHDDYSYAGPLYQSVLHYFNTPLVILFGVAHKARMMGIENKIVFGKTEYWKAPYGDIKVSSIQDEIITRLDTADYLIDDSLSRVEHSLEALLPFLQYHNRDLEIIPILVPAMPFNRMQDISGQLAEAIDEVLGEDDQTWGKGYSFVISSDAVHYGDEGWGGKNFALFGTNTEGYTKALSRENFLMDTLLSGQVNLSKLEQFTHCTVQDTSYRDYRWTWCGRYSIPFGLATVEKLAELQSIGVEGTRVGYLTSIDHNRIKVEDLGMGLTAPASLHHWVGYPGLLYFRKR